MLFSSFPLEGSLAVTLHQAALDQNLDLMKLLVAHGARTDIADTLWGGTPLDWTIHQNKTRARAYLEGLGAQS